jgi:predicted cation transporter
LVFGGLGLILALVLALPFLSKKIEHNIEVFLFAMGLGAAGISGSLSLELGYEAIREPVFISAAVLGAGLIFKVFMGQIRGGVAWLMKRLSIGALAFVLVVALGLASSLITAIIAALVLVEIVSVLGLPRRAEVTLDVVACFSIGLGAALTPIGEPLSTIATSKLGEDFWFLAGLLGPYVVPGIIALGVYAGWKLRGEAQVGAAAVGRPEAVVEGYRAVILRALRVYVFVMALVLLGEGFRPIIDRFVVGLPSQALYWLNMVSAVLDNATLTAAEISLEMSALQVQSVLMGLLIAGGMLIPGNIPNIVSAGKLDIGSREWAAVGVPLGLVVLVVYYVILFVL